MFGYKAEVIMTFDLRPAPGPSQDIGSFAIGIIRESEGMRIRGIAQVSPA